MLLSKALNESGLDVEAVVLKNTGYPTDESVLEDADTVVFFCTGFDKHLVNDHLGSFDTLMKKGVGVIMIHWATEAKDGRGSDLFHEWLGGHCDPGWSVNPHWEPHFDDLPDHPICNGVKPFRVDEEWYYHMRFKQDPAGLTSILADLPGLETLSRPDGERSGNPDVRRSVAAGEKQTVAWAFERPSGGRGFGFTGGHFHKSWQNDDYRKIMLNAILWTAQVEVPENGVESVTPTDEELLQNLDPKKKRKKSGSASS